MNRIRPAYLNFQVGGMFDLRAGGGGDVRRWRGAGDQAMSDAIAREIKAIRPARKPKNGDSRWRRPRRTRSGYSGLLGVDDAAADGAGAGEQLLKLVALAPADRPLKRGQVLVEPAQHLQHRFAVVEEDVAPHHRIGSGDAGKVAEA